MNRRDFTALALGTMAIPSIGQTVKPSPMGVPLRQEPLPFSFGALEPCFSAEGLRRHYMEYHAAHLAELKNALAERQMLVGNIATLMPGMEKLALPSKTNSKLPLGRLINLGSAQSPDPHAVESMARVLRKSGGGHVNHTAFWRFLCPAGAGPKEPHGKVARAIREDFGSIHAFRSVFKERAMAHPGSGWAWLVYRQDGALVATTTSNEDNPLMKEHIPWHQAGRPILALDLWEHSYIERHGDDRERYIDSWWKVVNWSFVERAYEIVTAMR